jgi:hypothetical protein
MALNGTSIGHVRNLTTAGGVGTVVQKFNCSGTLSVFVDIQKAGALPVNQTVQFNIAVTPELPAATLVLTASLSALIAILLARRRLVHPSRQVGYPRTIIQGAGSIPEKYYCDCRACTGRQGAV